MLSRSRRNTSVKKGDRQTGGARTQSRKYKRNLRSRTKRKRLLRTIRERTRSHSSKINANVIRKMEAIATIDNCIEFFELIRDSANEALNSENDSKFKKYEMIASNLGEASLQIFVNEPSLSMDRAHNEPLEFLDDLIDYVSEHKNDLASETAEKLTKIIEKARSELDSSLNSNSNSNSNSNANMNVRDTSVEELTALFNSTFKSAFGRHKI
jgi:hypothetical protein